jgi:carbonic anhydrase
MRLFEAILDANHRAVAGDANAGVHPGDFESELPVIALTCVDPRLNALFPNVLGLPGEQFIWLRNAGNILTGPLSSTMRSLALSCAIKGGKEIAIIGHTDCHVGRTTMMQLLEHFKNLGIERHLLPENINEFFGMFGSEPQNVIKACDIARRSPLISPQVPVHGLIVDTGTGKLDWIVNGYQTLQNLAGRWDELVKSAGQTVDALKSLSDFKIGEMKFPETRIGETVTKAEDWLAKGIEELGTKSMEQSAIGSKIGQAAQIAEKVVEIVGKTSAGTPASAGQPPIPPKMPHPIPNPPRLGKFRIRSSKFKS